MKDQFIDKAKSWDSVQWKIDLAENVYKTIKENRNINTHSHLVDIGGGTGLLTLKFVSDVNKITVIDTSKSMLNILKDKIKIFDINNVQIIEEYFTSDTYENNTIDIFISMMTLHHIPEIKDFFSSAYNALKTGGNISIIDLEAEPGDFHMEGVEYFHNGFNIQKIEEKLMDIGFKKIKINPLFNVTKKSKYNEIKTYPILYIEAYKY